MPIYGPKMTMIEQKHINALINQPLLSKICTCGRIGFTSPQCAHVDGCPVKLFYEVALYIEERQRLDRGEHFRRRVHGSWEVSEGLVSPNDVRAETEKAEPKHSHYHKPCPFDSIDVYRVFLLFTVTDPCIQHAMKKLFVVGGRGGGKDANKDVQESIDSLVRWQAMRAEEAAYAGKA